MGYFSTWTERLHGGVRLLAPYGVMIVLFIFSVISFSPYVGSPIKAPLLLMAIYYWAIYRPTIIPPWLVFLMGILMDFINGTPLGLNALIFVSVQWIVSDQRRYLMGQSYLMIWIGFVIVSLASSFAQWTIIGLVNMVWSSLKPLWFSVLLGVALFPLVSVILHLTHKILPEPQANFLLKPKSSSR